MPQQARLDSPGTLHHLMIRRIEGRRSVDEDRDRRDFVLRSGELGAASRTATYAWPARNIDLRGLEDIDQALVQLVNNVPYACICRFIPL
jgi:hypothetical protein